MFAKEDDFIKENELDGPRLTWIGNVSIGKFEGKTASAQLTIFVIH